MAAQRDDRIANGLPEATEKKRVKDHVNFRSCVKILGKQNKIVHPLFPLSVKE